MMVFAFTGCGFDEDPLQNRINDIKNRIAALQSRIDEANKQVETLGLLTSGNVVTSIDKNSDGSYVLTYLDSKNEEKTVVVSPPVARQRTSRLTGKASRPPAGLRSSPPMSKATGPWTENTFWIRPATR